MSDKSPSIAGHLLTAAGVLATFGLGRLVFAPTWLIFATAVVLLVLALLFNVLRRSGLGKAALIAGVLVYFLFAAVVLERNQLHIVEVEPGWYPRVPFPLSSTPAAYTIRTLRMRFSQSGNWAERLTVEVTDGSTQSLKRLLPANLRTSRAGHLEIVADVLAHGSGGAEGPVWLVTEDFYDFRSEQPLTFDETLLFDVPATMTLSILLDGELLETRMVQAFPSESGVLIQEIQ